MQEQEITEMRRDIEKLRQDVEKLRLLFEDAFLSKDEIDFVEKTIRDIKKGDTRDFVNVEELDEI